MGTGGSSLLSSPDGVFACKYGQCYWYNVGRYFKFCLQNLCMSEVVAHSANTCYTPPLGGYLLLLSGACTLKTKQCFSLWFYVVFSISILTFPWTCRLAIICYSQSFLAFVLCLQAVCTWFALCATVCNVHILLHKITYRLDYLRTQSHIFCFAKNCA